MILKTQTRYSCKVKLGFIDRLASNERVVEEFNKAGFINVMVTGWGSERIAQGFWPLETKEVKLPSQVVPASVVESV